MARHRIHSLAFKKQVVQEYAAGATLNGLAREHDLSRNLIRIWIAKCESGEFDPDLEAATLLAGTRPRSSRWSGWSAGRRSRSSS
jgi:transposase